MRTEEMKMAATSRSYGSVMVTTAQVAKMAGVCLRTVRYWETQGLMPPRAPGYRRLYVWADVRNVLRVYILSKGCKVKTEAQYLRFGKLLHALDDDASEGTFGASPHSFHPATH